MNLLKLNIVVLIEKYKKVTDVARELQLKQPTVTFHMKSLEEELGVPLFHSRKGRIVLTEAGRALYPYAQKMLSLHNEALRTMEEYKGMGRGTLRVGAEPAVQSLMMPVIADFLKRHPGIRIEVQVEPEQKLKALLMVEEIDAAIIEERAALELPLAFERWNEDEVVLICAADHPWVLLEELDPGQAGQERFVRHAPGSQLDRIGQAWADQHAINLWSPLTAASPEGVCRAVRAGAGVAFFSRKALAGNEANEGGGIRMLKVPGLEDPRLQLGAAYRKEGSPASLINEFVHFLRTCAQI
ncbi:LysR family transcriptional regulator [Paenibacillus sp. CAA11]|uniref:LysR family transcriptional regulator n=1 Tax=Paenibacillus sp. CAA11 TaxID=1532905 RepID=UPI00131F1336|nr:LysR family transcriptional regulator [Paenibacillus sp. CAA11]